MKKKIRILYVEDVSADAELALMEVSMHGINFTHSIVESRKEYIDALISVVPDLILSDYTLPQFDGMHALALRNEIAPQTPFIIVTGSINEEVAVECMKAGADDYILKRNLSRLVPAIKAAFEKRDRILMKLQSESDLGKKAENLKIDKQTSPAQDDSTLKEELSSRDEYQIIEEKLTILDMAMESAGIGSWVFDLKGNKRYFDGKACELFGFAQANYKKSENEFFEVIHPDDRSNFKFLLSETIDKRTDFELEFRVVQSTGTIRFLIARAKTIIDNNGTPVRLIGLVWDITEYKMLQITLQENIRKTNSIVNNLNGAVYRCKLDLDRTMEYVSEGIKELTGYPSWDFLMNRTRSFSSLICTDDKERVSKIIRDALEVMIPFTVEYKITSASNETKWIWERGRGIYSGKEVIAIEGFFTDISEKKKFEEELRSSLKQQHQLTNYIEKVRENERVAISRELHDDLGQSLTAVKIDLGNIRQKTSEKEIATRIIKVSDLVSDTIKTVQRLTSQLRPQIIDDLGLVSAIEWYTNEFKERNQVQVALDLDPSVNINHDASLIIFRVMQEALTNISRHSKADQVSITLSRNEDEVNLIISDNGVGITESQIKSNKSFGIISMRERAASRGGKFEISGLKNGGTILRLIFPLKTTGYYEDSDL
jgi:PAS domain S-box-containing protein